MYMTYVELYRNIELYYNAIFNKNILIEKSVFDCGVRKYTARSFVWTESF